MDEVTWLYFKEEPFQSMGADQWKAIGRYLRLYAAEKGFEFKEMKRVSAAAATTTNTPPA